MEELNEHETYAIRNGLARAKEVFNKTYDYSNIDPVDPREAERKRINDWLEIQRARKVIALTDSALGRPDCNLSVAEYWGLISDLPICKMEVISVSDFSKRSGLVLPYGEEAVRYTSEELKFSYLGKDFVFPKRDEVYFFNFKIGEDGKPIIDKGKIVIFTLTNSTYGMKGGNGNEL